MTIILRYAMCLLFAGIAFIIPPGVWAADLKLEETGEEQVRRLNLGEMEILAVEDTAGSMDVGLFSGPLNQTERLAFMPGGSAPSSVNVFVIRSEGKTILVDTGWGQDGKTRGNMLRRLAALGVKPDQVDYVLLTHMHGDHVSGLLNKGRPVFPKATVLAARPEKEFWLEKAPQLTPYKNGAALAAKVAKAYESRFNSFQFGDEVLPGVRAVEAVGHTPGHCAFLVGSGEGSLLIVGDLLHAAALQFANPDECASYDMDKAAAAATRKALLGRAADEKLLISGMHIPFSGMGYVKKRESGGFDFIPLP